MDIIINFLMMIIIVIFIIINKLKGKSLLSIVQLQNIVWLTAFFIYSVKIINYYPLLAAVYVYSFEYLLSFNIAYLTKITLKHKKRYASVKQEVDLLSKDSICDKNKVNRCVIASIFAYIVGIRILQKSINILITFGSVNGLNALRYRTYGEYSIFSTFEMCLITFIIRPIFIVTIILMAEQISIRKYDIKLIAISLLDALMIVLMTAGRTMMVSLVFYVFFAVITVNGINIKRIINRYRRHIIIAVVVLVVFISISSRRVNRSEGIIYEIILYYFSGLPFLSSMLTAGRIEYLSLHGMGTFSPFVDTITLSLRLFGFSISGGSQAIANITDSALKIGENVATNATASTLLPFIMDFGYFGPAISGFLIGFLCKMKESEYLKNPSAVNYGKYLFLLVAMVTSIQNYALLGVATLTTWVFMTWLLGDWKGKLIKT